MLVAVLILLCLVIFLNLLILGELILTRRRSDLGKITPKLPIVTKEILSTITQGVKRSIDDGTAFDQYAKWMGGLARENPILALYIQNFSKEVRADVSCLNMYQALKAQLEADHLSNLTKIQR